MENRAVQAQTDRTVWETAGQEQPPSLTALLG